MEPQVTIGQDIIQTYRPYRRTAQQPTVVTTHGSTQFVADLKYQLGDIVYRGAGSVIVAAKVAEGGHTKDVAIKKLTKAFEWKGYAIETLLELKLRRLLTHENVTIGQNQIIGISSIVLPNSRQDFSAIYTVEDLMESDLHAVIKSQQELTNDHHLYFMYQILRGLKYMHSAGIIHKDLKPRNVLINSNCDIKLSGMRTDKSYSSTRWYASPEYLLGTKDFAPSMDMWSIGCIFAQLILKKPFLTRPDNRTQLESIAQVFGELCPEDFTGISNEAKSMIERLPKKLGRSLKEHLPGATELGLDLISRMFVLNPTKRITAAEALEHPYFEIYHDPSDEPTRQPINPLEVEFESRKLTLEQCKDLLYEQILLCHFPAFKQSYMNRLQNGQSVMSHIFDNSNSKVRYPDNRDCSDDD